AHAIQAQRLATTAHAVQGADRRALGHVHQHGADPEPPLAVATAVVETHARTGMVHTRPAFRRQDLARFQVQAVDAVLHGADPAAVLQTGDAADLLSGTPTGVLLIAQPPAVHGAGRHIDPVQGLFPRMPDRAFPRLVAQMHDQ